jgi:hypothetical protein
MGMREVMQALSEGAGRQSAIGGLMFQDAQMREGRAYEAAMAKEAERRANLEWRGRQDILAETAEDVAAQANTYRLGEIEAQGQISKDVTQQGIDADIEAAKQAHETWKDQFKIEQDQATKIREETAKSELELEKWKAKSKALLGRAEKEDEKTLEAYKQLVENPAYKDEDGNWNENIQYLEEFAKAQARSDKAWTDYLSYSGIDIKQPKPTDTWGPMAMTLSADLKKTMTEGEWNDLIKGLATGGGPAGKGGKSYDEAIARIKKAVNDLGIDFMPSQVVEIQERMTQVLTKMAAEGVDTPPPPSGDQGDGEVSEPAVTPTPTTEGVRAKQGTLREELTTIEAQIPELKSQYTTVLEERNKEKAAYNHSDILRRIFESGMPVDEVQSAYETNPDLFKDGKGDTIPLDRVLRIWAVNRQYNTLQIKIRELESRASQIKIEIQKIGTLSPQLSEVQNAPRGMLDTGNRGMISMADNRGWSPEEVDARARSALEQQVA